MHVRVRVFMSVLKLHVFIISLSVIGFKWLVPLDGEIFIYVMLGLGKTKDFNVWLICGN